LQKLEWHEMILHNNNFKIISYGLLSNSLFLMSWGWPAASTPNLEGQVIFDQGFLPLALDKPISNCKAAVLVSVRPWY
jgi:hypothetical protein